jgi:hypothetical protein
VLGVGLAVGLKIGQFNPKRNFVDFLYQSRPISTENLAGQFQITEAGDFIVGDFLFSISTRNNAIKSIIN